MLTGKNILLGVCGGIACYKVVEVASQLRKLGANVDVVMTKEATKFVSALTFQEITGNKVSVDMWEKVHNFNVEHIALAQKADIALIAPATANIIGKLSSGIADDMLSTVLMAFPKKTYLAPSMNSNMYQNPIFQRNLAILKELPNYEIITPDKGYLACGVNGIGRLPEPKQIVRFILDKECGSQSLKGKVVLVTAGGTKEKIDPVRFIGNRSSGKMGYALAEAASRCGAKTILISTVHNLPVPNNVEVIYVETANEMQEKINEIFDEVDITIMAAAVADYKVINTCDQKIKKSENELTLHLTKNPDILAELGKRKKSYQILIGFAAETNDLVKYAQEKLQKKNLDLIVANDVSRSDAGFDSDKNAVKLLFKNGKIEDIDLMDKKDLSRIIIDKIQIL